MTGRLSPAARPLNVFVYEPWPLGKVFGNLRTLLYILEGAPAAGVHCIVAAPFESELADRVRGLGADWVVLAPPAAINRYGGQVLRESLPGRAKALAGLIRYNFRVRRFLRERRVDLVYCNSLRSLLTVGLAAMLAGVPRVWYVKGALENGLLDRLGFLMANRILYFCETNRDDRYPLLVRLFGRKIEIVHIGLDVSMINRIGARPDASLPADGTLSVGYLGQLFPPKGVHFLVEAFAQVAPRFPGATLYLIGDSGIDEYAHYTDELRALIEARGLTGRVVFTGWRDDALAIARTMTVMVHPSLSEGFGRAVLEAMALGKPVIASGVGGLREAVRDGQNGFLVPPGDADAIAARLTLLFSNAEVRDRMGAAAQATVYAEYQIEDKIRQLCGIWHEAARTQAPMGAGAAS